MKKKIISRLTIQLMCIVLLFISIDIFGQCDGILSQGIYDYQNTSSSRDLSSSFINWYKNQDIQTFQKAKSVSGSATLPLEGIMVGMGFSYNESGFQQFQKFVENYASKTENEKSKFDQAFKTINRDIVSAWKDCMNSPGLHVWIEHTSDEFEFVLCANFIPDGPTTDVGYLKSIEFGGGSVTSSGTILYNNGKTTSGKLSAAYTYQIFRRNNNKPFTIVVTANRGRGLRYSFSGIGVSDIDPKNNLAIFEETRKKGHGVPAPTPDEMKAKEKKRKLNIVSKESPYVKLDVENNTFVFIKSGIYVINAEAHCLQGGTATIFIQSVDGTEYIRNKPYVCPKEEVLLKMKNREIVIKNPNTRCFLGFSFTEVGTGYISGMPTNQNDPEVYARIEIQKIK